MTVDLHPLTPAEREIMKVIWEHPGATVLEVVAELADGRAYTTVLTLLRILEQKGHVTATREGRRHLYTASHPRLAHERALVDGVVRDVFAGDASRLVRHLVEGDALGPAERAELRRLLGDA